MIKFNLKLSSRLEHHGKYGVYNDSVLICWCDTEEKAKMVKEELIKFMKGMEEE